MKFLKKSQINFRNVSDNSIAIQIDGEVTMDTPNVLLMPKGSTAQRPTSPVTGHIRYNTTTNEVEVYQGSTATWKPLSYKEPKTITVQTFGPGDAVETKFGPLDSGWSSAYTTAGYGNYTVPISLNNIFVIVENVIQIPTTNYSLEENPLGYPAGTYVTFATPVPLGKSVTIIHGFDL
jgi:hypothetical protein